MSGILRPSVSLSLSAADTIANAAIQAVSTLKTHKPMVVTVLDGAGGVLVQKRMDGCPDGAYRQFSYAKARTCIHLNTSSRTFREKYTAGGEAPKFTQAASMVSVMDGELIPVAGGVLVQSEGKPEINNQYPCRREKIVEPSSLIFYQIFVSHFLENKDGSTVGAVGVSGAAADEDEYLAWAGVQPLKEKGGLLTVPENHCCKTLKET
jgi:uncharacterized protein GlcG (DUF336 family)